MRQIVACRREDDEHFQTKALGGPADEQLLVSHTVDFRHGCEPNSPPKESARRCAACLWCGGTKASAEARTCRRPTADWPKMPPTRRSRSASRTAPVHAQPAVTLPIDRFHPVFARRCTPDCVSRVQRPENFAWHHVRAVKGQQLDQEPAQLRRPSCAGPGARLALSRTRTGSQKVSAAREYWIARRRQRRSRLDPPRLHVAGKLKCQ